MGQKTGWAQQLSYTKWWWKFPPQPLEPRLSRQRAVASLTEASPRLKNYNVRSETESVKSYKTWRRQSMLPTHIYTTRCGSFFTWIRAHVTPPRYCRANIPIYIRLLYHFTARTTHCYCYITTTPFLFSAVTFYVSHSVPWILHYGPGLADFIVPLILDLILNEHFIMTFISAQSKKKTDVPFIPHTRLPIHWMTMKKDSYFRVGGTGEGGEGGERYRE